MDFISDIELDLVQTSQIPTLDGEPATSDTGYCVKQKLSIIICFVKLKNYFLKSYAVRFSFIVYLRDYEYLDINDYWFISDSLLLVDKNSFNLPYGYGDLVNGYTQDLPITCNLFLYNFKILIYDFSNQFLFKIKNAPNRYHTSDIN